MRSLSLRSRAALAAVPVLVLALGLVAYAVSQANYRGSVSALQTRMESYVYAVLAAMDVGSGGVLAVEEEFADPRLLQPGSGLFVQVVGENIDWRSASALGAALPELNEISAGQTVFNEPAVEIPFFVFQYGIGWQQDDGRIVPFTVSVLVDQDELLQQTRAFRSGLWRSLAMAGAILILAQLVIAYLVFQPLRSVARDVARIESGRSERLEDEYPRELEPLARNVNRLLETEQSNQQRIRNALDSLAHSLKTPLAVIQAGLPMHGGDSEKSMQNAVEEMQHLIATRLERAGSSARRTLATPVPVAEQLQRIVDSMQKVHSHELINADLKIEAGLNFYGEQRDLLELAGNLVDNAFKYGRSRVEICGGVVEPDGPRPGLWLRVEDDGPGIEESMREKLLQRGVRGDERVEGHGLGLAIVLELVTAYGGELSISQGVLGGAAVEVRIPAG